MVSKIAVAARQDALPRFDIGAVRSDFPALQCLVHGKPIVYLDNAATTHKPQTVLDAIVEFYTECNSNVHRGVHLLSEKASDAFENARESVKDFLGAESREEIIFTRGTTESINLVAQAFGREFIVEGDEIIVSGLEHHSNLIPWQELCKNRGAILKILPFDMHGQLQLELLPELLSARTKLIGIILVSNVLGVRTPVEEVIRMAHAQDVPVLIDGAQAVAHLPVDVKELDCDFFAFSGHKFYAEMGIGVLYGKKRWLEAMPPYQTGGGMVTAVSHDGVSFEALPYRFEAGTGNVAGAISLAAAIRYLHSLGLESVFSYEHQLLSYAENQLRQLDGVSVYGEPESRFGAISFNLCGVHPHDAAMILDKLGIAVRTGTHCAEPLVRRFDVSSMIRASFALYSTTEEVDALVSGIKRVQSMLGA